jgi:hypothetical protein
MIQLRWRKIDDNYHGYENVVKVRGADCVLEYRIHFVPSQVSVPGAGHVIVLEEARECDKVWKEVVINE